LGLKSALWPIGPWAFFALFSAFDISLCELNFNADSCVSLDVLSNRLKVSLVDVDVDVVLEADSIDWALFGTVIINASFFHFLDHVEHFVRFCLERTIH